MITIPKQIEASQIGDYIGRIVGLDNIKVQKCIENFINAEDYINTSMHSKFVKSIAKFSEKRQAFQLPPLTYDDLKFEAESYYCESTEQIYSRRDPSCGYTAPPVKR